MSSHIHTLISESDALCPERLRKHHAAEMPAIYLRFMALRPFPNLDLWDPENSSNITFFVGLFWETLLDNPPVVGTGFAFPVKSRPCVPLLFVKCLIAHAARSL